MSRSNYDVIEEYTGAGNKLDYTFSFKIEEKSQLLVIEKDAAGIVTNEVRGTDVATYIDSVVFDSDAGGGTVNLLVNLPSSYTLKIILANDAPTQPTLYKNKGEFTLKSFENALDWVLGPVQRLSWLAGRSVKLPDSVNSADFDADLPVALIGTPGVTVVTNPTGDALIVGPTVDEISDAAGFADAAAASEAAAAAAESAAAASEAAAVAAAAAAAASEANVTAAVPTGGATGQLLEKIDGDDFNTQWANPKTTYTFLDMGNIHIAGNTISSTDTNGDINLTPDGSGEVNISSDLNVTGKIFSTDSVNLPDGTVSDLSLRFTSDTNTGLFLKGTDSISLVAGGFEGLNVRKSTGNFANVGMGSVASLSDAFPIVVSRSNAAGLTLQISNPLGSSSATATLDLAADIGSTDHTFIFTAPNASVVDGYKNRSVIRSVGNDGISLIADTGNVELYAAGVWAANLIATAEATSFKINNNLPLRLEDSGTNYVGVKTPSTVTSSYELTLPAAQGSANKTLVNDGAGVLSWGDGGNSLDVNTLNNMGLQNTVAANAMTIRLKQTDGSTDATPSAPISIAFRSSTPTSGATTLRTVSSALSIVIPSGATLGHSDGVEGFIYVYALDISGTVELAVSSVQQDVAGVVVTTAIGSGSDESGFYSTAARTSVPARLLYRTRSTQTTVGTWLSNLGEVRAITSDIALASEGAVSGGLKNYISTDNSKFEKGIGDWGVEIGTGVSIAITTSASEILESSQSLKITKDAANRSTEFVKVLTSTIDLQDRGRQLFGSIEMRPLTGYVSGDLILEIYDETNSAVLFSGLAADLEIPNNTGRFNFIAHTESTTAQIEIRLKINNTNTNAFDFVIDDIRVGPATSVPAYNSTDWEVFTPTWTTSLGTLPSTSAETASWRRDGTDMLIKFHVAMNGAGVGNGFHELTIPNSKPIDSAFYSSIGSQVGGGQIDGASMYDTSGGFSRAFTAFPSTTTTIAFVGADASVFGRNSEFASGDTLSGIIRVRIEDWESSNIVSQNELALKSVEVRASLSSSQSISTGADTTIIFATESKDNFSIYDSTTGIITITKTGTYKARTKIRWDTNATGRRVAKISLNGSSEDAASEVDAQTTGGSQFAEKTYDLVAGDTLEVVVFQNSGSNLNVIIPSYFQLESIPDFTVIGAIHEPASYIKVRSATGYGSTNTKIPIYSTIVDEVGPDLTYATSAADGTSITVNAPGIYTVSLRINLTIANKDAGVSVNGSSLATSITAQADDEIFLLGRTATGGGTFTLNSTYVCKVGDVMRPHTDGTSLSVGSAINEFSVSKVH